MKLTQDKYYTDEGVAKHCIDKTYEIIGKDWNRIIEPSAGAGAFLKFLPKDTIAYDIAPEIDNVIQADYKDTKLPYLEKSLVIGNPPFGRANRLSVQFVKHSLEHSDYIAFIQPISQLNQNRSMKDTELLYSEDLGLTKYSNRTIHCCFNIYHRCKDGHKQNLDIEGINTIRHIIRTGCEKSKEEFLTHSWDFRISAWGNIHLLDENEFTPNEVVIDVDEDKPELKAWVKNKLEECDYQELISCVSTPNLPAWRLRKWLKSEYEKEGDIHGKD